MKTHPKNPTHLIAAVALIIAAGVLAYSNSFNGAFVYEDARYIIGNPPVQGMGPWWRHFQDPTETGESVGGPLTNLTFAINRTLGGTGTLSFHAANLAIHILAGLALLGILRNTLILPPLRAQYGKYATWLAAITAILWTVHPLGTQAVTYISQRAESLMGLLLLSTLYCAIRGWRNNASPWWHALAVLSFFFGTGTKGAIVAAPLVVLGYDWFFFEGNLSLIFRRSRFLYQGLALGLAALACVVIITPKGLMGHAVSCGPWEYLAAQPSVIVHYLRLLIWPDNLCLDYTWPGAGFGQHIPFTAGIILAVALSSLAMAKRKPAGALGLWFFVLLAPTSLAPFGKIAGDERMYLAMAAPILLLVLGGFRILSVLIRKNPRHRRLTLGTGLALAWALAMAWGVGTHVRNSDFSSNVHLLTKDVEYQPQNPMVHLNLGNALVHTNKTIWALHHYHIAVDLAPDSFAPRFALATALASLGHMEKSIPHYDHAVTLEPDSAPAHEGLGSMLLIQGKLHRGMAHLEEALRLAPDNDRALNNLGLAFLQLKDHNRAMALFRQALSINPRSAEAWDNTGLGLAISGQAVQAMACFREAIGLDPTFLQARINLAATLDATGDTAQAIREMETAARLHPDAAIVRDHIQTLKEKKNKQKPLPRPTAHGTP